MCYPHLMAVIEVIEVGFAYLDHLAVAVKELHFEIEEVAFPHVVWRLLLKLGHYNGVRWPVGEEGCVRMYRCDCVFALFLAHAKLHAMAHTLAQHIRPHTCTTHRAIHLHNTSGHTLAQHIGPHTCTTHQAIHLHNTSGHTLAQHIRPHTCTTHRATHLHNTSGHTLAQHIGPHTCTTHQVYTCTMDQVTPCTLTVVVTIPQNF